MSSSIGDGSSSELNLEKLNWLDITLFSFAPPEEKLADTLVTMDNELIWDEKLVPWDSVHAYLIKKEKRKRETVANADAIAKALNSDKETETAKKMEKKKDFIHKEGWDTRDACCVNELWDGLYLGNMNSAGSEVFIKSNNIGAILNVTPNIAQYFDSLKNKRISIADSVDAPWECMLMEAMDFLDRCYASNTKVLVHCRMGQSRSVSYVLAWGMLRFKYPLRELEASLQIKRYGGIKVNVGFRTRLGMIAEKLGMENLNARSCITTKRKRYSEEFAFASYRQQRPRNWNIRSARIRIPRSRPRFLPYSHVFKKLQARNNIGILYKNKTYGKMNSDGFMLNNEDKPIHIINWELHIADSGAKNFNKLASIVDIDGKKLKEPINMREYRIANADYFDTVMADANASKNNDTKSDVKASTTESIEPETITPNAIQSNNYNDTPASTSDNNKHFNFATSDHQLIKEGPVTIV